MNNPTLDIREYVDRDDTEYISFLQTKIELLRQLLYQYAESIPVPLNRILINHYKERLGCAEDRPMLGEYAAFMVGDLFSIKPQIVDQLAFPWLLLYEYSLLLDDLLDKSRSRRVHELLLTQILLESSLTRYRSLLGDNSLLWAVYDSYRQQSTNGILHEIEWSTNVSRMCDNGVIIEQGRKSAIVKFCATSIVYFDKKRLLSSREEEGIDHLCAGIQLLDDLTDVFEDHKAGRLNVLLKDAYDWLENNTSKSTHSMQLMHVDVYHLMAALSYSGAIERSWMKAAEQIDEALDLFTDVNSQTARYFHSISTKCRESANLIRELMSETPEFHGDFVISDVNGRHATISDIRSLRLSELIVKINEHVSTGPKASN